MKVSSASAIPLSIRGLSRRNRCRCQRKLGCRWVNAAEFGGLRQALALDHRSGVIEPFLFLAQMRHMGVLVRALNVRPQLLQRYRKSPCERPQPMISRPAMQAASALDALMAGGSKRILAMAAPSAISSAEASSAKSPDPEARLRAARLRQRLQRLTPLVPAQARNRRQPSRKVLSPHRITPSIRLRMN